MSETSPLSLTQKVEPTIDQKTEPVEKNKENGSTRAAKEFFVKRFFNWMSEPKYQRVRNTALTLGGLGLLGAGLVLGYSGIEQLTHIVNPSMPNHTDVMNVLHGHLTANRLIGLNDPSAPQFDTHFDNINTTLNNAYNEAHQKAVSNLVSGSSELGLGILGVAGGLGLGLRESLVRILRGKRKKNKQATNTV